MLHPDAEAFLRLLDPSPGARFGFQTFDDDKTHKSPKLVRQFFGTLEQHAAELERLNAEGAGVFVTVNETDGVGFSTEHITRVRTWFVDLDGALLGPIPTLDPLAVVESSPNRYHAYWPAAQGTPVDPEVYRTGQRLLVARFGADPACVNLSRVLRMPGFRHQKPGPNQGHLTTLLLSNDSACRLGPAQLGARFLRSPRTELCDFEVTEIAERVADLPPAIQGQNGSGRAFHAACEAAKWLRQALCLEGDAQPPMTLGVQALSAWNARCEPPWSEDELRHKWADASRKVVTEAVATANADTRVIKKWDVAKLVAVLREDPELGGGRLRFNDHTHDITLGGVRIDDDVAVRAQWVGLCERYQFRQPTLKESDFCAVFELLARESRFNPVVDRLRQCADGWDRQPRIEALAPALLRTRNPLAGVYLHKWMIGAVARALEPGCKMDTVLTLVGLQGFQKSGAFRTLAMLPEAFSDTKLEPTNKDVYAALHAAWIFELAEIESLYARADQATLKNILSSQEDMVRLPYARRPVRLKRRSVNGATTNDDHPLRDHTGDRRFWVLRVDGEIDLQRLRDVVEALWGEAVHDWTEGQETREQRCLWWLTPAEDAQRAQHNAEFRQPDIERDAIQRAVWRKESHGPVEIEPTELIRECGFRTQAWNHKIHGLLDNLGYSASPDGLWRKPPAAPGLQAPSGES